uniref:Protein sleepless n=1 Tax=Globodera pallida TaxID=36090 RepID=A0A183BR07_GLOPA
MNIFALTTIAVVLCTCNGLKCKYGRKEKSNEYNETIECDKDSHYCVAANCAIVASIRFWEPGIPITHRAEPHRITTYWDCFKSNDMNACVERFQRIKQDVIVECDPCFIGQKDVDLANVEFSFPQNTTALLPFGDSTQKVVSHGISNAMPWIFVMALSILLFYPCRV